MLRKILVTLCIAALLFVLATVAYFVFRKGNTHQQDIGSVSTKHNWLTPDDAIKVSSFDDPDVNGVTCYISYAEKGGASSMIGLAEDTSDVSIACRQVGSINFSKIIQNGEDVFSRNASPLFKKTKVVRMIDEKRNVLVYVATTSRVIEGSPKNSISVVPVDKDNPIKAKSIKD